MARGRRILVAAVVAVVAAGVYYWRPWRRDVSKDLEPEYVDELSVTTNGSPLPETIRNGEPYTVVIRFRMPPSRAGMNYVPLLFVVGPDGYDGKRDHIEAFHQTADGFGPGFKLIAIRDGRTIDVTPKPPASGDPSRQYCALLDSRSFSRNAEASGPLELHIWLYPKEASPYAQTPISGDGHLIFIHPFQFERVDNK